MRALIPSATGAGDSLVEEVHPPVAAAPRAFDPGEQRVGTGALVADRLRKAVLRVLEHDADVGRGPGGEDRRGLPARMRLVRQRAVLLAQDDELEVDQAPVAHRPADAHHGAAARRGPLLLDRLALRDLLPAALQEGDAVDGQGCGGRW